MREFTMSMYASKEDLYKDKSEYYEFAFHHLLQWIYDETIDKELATLEFVQQGVHEIIDKHYKLKSP